MKYQGIALAGIFGVMLAYIPVSLSALASRERNPAYHQTPSVPMLPPVSEMPPPLYPMFPPENIQQPAAIAPEEKVAPAPVPAPQPPASAAPAIIINNNNNNNNGYNAGGYGAIPPIIIYPNEPRSETIQPSTSDTPAAPVAPSAVPPVPTQTPYTAPVQSMPAVSPAYGYTPPVSGRQFITYEIRSGLSDANLKQLQYYVSADILLSRNVAADYKAPTVSAGQVVFNNGQYIERIFISKDTPGQLMHKTVAYRQDGVAVELLGICFEQNRNNILYFQPAYGFYGFMNAPGTYASGVQTTYGRYVYEVFLPEASWPYLMGVVNMEYQADQSRNAPGRPTR
jgi:hypothetical protein